MSYESILANTKQVAELQRLVAADITTAQKDTLVFAVTDVRRKLAFVMRVHGKGPIDSVVLRGVAPVWHEFKAKPKALHPKRELTAWFSDLSECGDAPEVRVLWRGITTTVDAARRKTEAIHLLKMEGFKILNVRA